MTSIKREFSRGTSYTLQLLLLLHGIGYSTGCTDHVDPADSASLDVPVQPIQATNPFLVDVESMKAPHAAVLANEKMAIPSHTRPQLTPKPEGSNPPPRFAMPNILPESPAPIANLKRESANQATQAVVSIMDAPEKLDHLSEGNLVELPLDLNFSADVFSTYQPPLEEYSYESYALENHSYIAKSLSSFSIDGELLMNEDEENYIESVEGAKLNFKWEM